MKYLLSIVLFFLGFSGLAQEVETYLLFDAEKADRYQMEKEFPLRAGRGTGSLSLPFFDDFSTYSLPTSDPEIPVELQRWDDDNAAINCNFPIKPPTVGVATLDGLDRTGYPYDFSSPDTYGPADTLTSLPINLAGAQLADNIYLTFFYQGGGRGNAPDPQDSLILEFFAPAGGDNPWIEVWSIPGSEMVTFENVFIPVDNQIFFQDGFRFRFRNYATLTGNLDHWHIDYVFMDDNINPEDFNYFEVAFVDCEYTLLRNFSAMPWTHFKANASLLMADTVKTLQQNLSSSQADNVTSGFKVEYEGTIWNNLNDFSQVVVLPEDTFVTQYAVNDAPNDFVYDTTVNDTCAIFNVSFYEDNIGILFQEKIGVPNNDSITFQQVFTNYYAYDDGTAERAYALNTAGSRMAVQFPIEIEDSLLGLFIHFTPFQDDNSGESFILRAWASSGGVPGAELQENYGFSSPNYYDDGYNVFAYYPYDSPIHVNPGNIFVGFVQDSDAQLNVGLDKNTNANATRLYYQLGNGASWTQSSVQGSLMIRPVFKSGKTLVWNGIEEDVAPAFTVYPNPSNGLFTFQFDSSIRAEQIEIFNGNGALIFTDKTSIMPYVLDLESESNGLYFIIIRDATGNVIGRERLVKSN